MQPTRTLLPLAAAAAIIACGVPSRADSTVTVNPNNPQQVIVGFGGSDAWQAENVLLYYTPSQQQQIFDLLFSDQGADLSIIRHRIPYEIEPSPGVWDWTQDDATVWFDHQAAQRGVQTVFATPWTMPAWMKTNDDVNFGGALEPQHYQDYADYLAKYVEHYDNHNFRINVLSLQNEPDIDFVDYDSCGWTSQEFHDFILNNLIPTFIKDKTDVTVMMPEMSGWGDSDAADTLADPTTADFIGIVAAHEYSGPPSGPFSDAEARGKQTWETEVSNLGNNDPSINDGLYWATTIHQTLVNAHANAWNWWWLITFDSTGQGLINGNTDGTFTINKRIFTIGNFSRFVRPGARMVTMSSNNPEPGVYLSAYIMESTGHVSIVAINNNATSTNVTIDMPGITNNSVPSYRTSATENLVDAGHLPVSGGSFVVTLPAQSVTTVTAHAAVQLLTPPIQVAAGGGPYGSFVADTDFFGGNTFSVTTPVDVSNTVNPAPASLYQTMRWGQFHYLFSGLNIGSKYTVRLHFAETYWTQPGQRLFNVLINRQLVLQNFDVLSTANGPNKAITEEFPATADRFGNIEVTFTNGSANNAMVSGIEILPPGP